MEIKFKKIHAKAEVPKQGREGDAAWDLTACEAGVRSEYESGEAMFIEYNTGIAIAVPEDHVGLVFPRSSISNRDLILKNCIGVIDPNYRGAITTRFWVTEPSGIANIYNVGDRIAQLVIIPRPFLEFEEVEDLGTTNRNAEGYGSSDNLPK